MDKPHSDQRLGLAGNLSVRWTHPESESIVSGKLGHGDVSFWSQSVSRPSGVGPATRGPDGMKGKRPEVGRVERSSHPVRCLSDVHPVINQPDIAKAVKDAILIGAVVIDNSGCIMAKRAERIVPIAARFANHYKSSVKRIGVEPMLAQAIALESIPRAELEAWLASKKQMEIPRE